MRKTIISLCLFFLFSCHTASYLHDLNSTTTGINFPEGQWLLNTVNAPEDIKEKLTKITYNALYTKLGDNIKKETDLTHVSLPFVQINSSQLVLSQIKKETKFDYLVNVVSQSTKNDIGNVKIGQTFSQRKNVAETILEIYDLNTLEQVYYRKVSGQVAIDQNDNEDFALVKSNDAIMVRCLKKIIKKMKL